MQALLLNLHPGNPLLKLTSVSRQKQQQQQVQRLCPRHHNHSQNWNVSTHTHVFQIAIILLLIIAVSDSGCVPCWFFPWGVWARQGSGSGRRSSAPPASVHLCQSQCYPLHAVLQSEKQKDRLMKTFSHVNIFSKTTGYCPARLGLFSVPVHSSRSTASCILLRLWKSR